MKTLVVLEYPMLYTKFQGHLPLGLFEVVYHIWAWSCDLEHLNKFSFPTCHGGSIWNLASIGLAVSEQKKFALDKGQWMTLTFDILVQFLYKCIRDQIWPFPKICQGQPKVIIWTNLVVLQHLIPNFKVICLLVPEKKIFKAFYLTVNPLYKVGVGPQWFMTFKWIWRCNDFMFFDHRMSKLRTHVPWSYPGLPCPHPLFP